MTNESGNNRRNLSGKQIPWNTQPTCTLYQLVGVTSWGSSPVLTQANQACWTGFPHNCNGSKPTSRAPTQQYTLQTEALAKLKQFISSIKSQVLIVLYDVWSEDRLSSSWPGLLKELLEVFTEEMLPLSARLCDDKHIGCVNIYFPLWRGGRVGLSEGSPPPPRRAGNTSNLIGNRVLQSNIYRIFRRSLEAIFKCKK